ncbi:nitric oxide dioxygenase [Virgibacillus subterraneus]|uniref:Flavohemoprotein n=1 Tax=Virgibacillus subterraneus TaxID=621109 RepID=A0A1H9KLB8_9BACI|nr:nitric oxide dioxygenase [Virgibacillus subterraneus]
MLVTSITTGLDSQTKDIVKSTVPLLQERGEDITKRFYQLLFKNNPELKNIFNQTNQRKGNQSKALANAVYSAAFYIDELERIMPQVKQIAHKHKSLNIQPEHYPIVGENLLAAIKEVLGESADEEVLIAWEKAYSVIADVFISTEKEMYQEAEKTIGGWSGFRNFMVVDKVVESDVITSLYLEAADGEPFAIHQPGQYITVKAEIEGAPYNYLRQYSLSCAPGGGAYRISVKREDALNGHPPGIVSNYLHSDINKGSILPITVPSGYFTLDSQDIRPLVLISGGVGLTPLLSMLESTIKNQPEREIYYIHATQNGKVHAMREAIQNIDKKHDQVHTYTVYDNPTDNDVKFYDKVGYIDYNYLSTILPTNNAAFYFCGPKGFMQSIYKSLSQFEVEDKDINYEFFGPSEEIKD